MRCSEVSHLRRAWRCVYRKVFKVSTDEAVHFNESSHRVVCFIDNEISCKKQCAVNWATNQPGDNQLGDNIWSTWRQIIKLENSIMQP